MDKIAQLQTPFLQNQFLEKMQPEPQATGFGDVFKNALKEVSAAQNVSDKKTDQLLTGEVKDVHEVMIASQKASLSLQMTMQVRNKVVEAYQEVMRMQV
ncbi:flagellar hook-basal body complex protein FliE [Planococcus sp. CP5-4]|uniref:flagellar hook-basal body complex protein FliE n=1 Tax=Planococcus TaxID=1372 RepID=UPI001B8D1C4B|nr:MULTISPECIES: flagellar hook-basal body complex protein FliE [unclassified Planococcus (in: firmicutes)]MBU9672603.1 flagellar hook-basal body complex protein FliE [Planococcus sp. CP5-4_YE]MBV0909653.1 flagellar hook-basal body complex protein FliE [Planococcus sp. CP5-4_UN]MBW6064383.1 flagellar hook-basal body complex protein FliE [Planococcus sp. CP5-4]MDN5710019.1 flagellar hook-basal body complex protein FliE [Planococcus sp. (in: firmicutes)]